MLQNARILVTRPQEHATPLCDELRVRGAIPVLYSGLSFAPCDDILLVDAELARAANGEFDVMILTSREAARVISERLTEIEVSLVGQIVWTVGSYTAQACHFEATIQTPPDARDALTLLAALPDVRGQRILLPQSPLAAPTLQDGLTERGATVKIIHPYQVVPGEGNDDVPEMIRQGQIQAMTFFSGSAVEGVIHRLESADLSRDTLKNIPAICFGASTASTARHMGLSVWEGDTTYETFYRLLEQACS